MPYNEDFETSAFFNNTNNIKAEITGFGTKRSFDIFMLVLRLMPFSRPSGEYLAHPANDSVSGIDAPLSSVSEFRPWSLVKKIGKTAPTPTLSSHSCVPRQNFTKLLRL
ncbi:MAG: hypothetical protein ACI96N_003211 [Arenicella sp.]